MGFDSSKGGYVRTYAISISHVASSNLAMSAKQSKDNDLKLKLQ